MTPYDRAIDWLSTFVVVSHIEVVVLVVLSILAGILIGAVLGRQTLHRRLVREAQTLLKLQREREEQLPIASESVRGGVLAAPVGENGMLAKATPPNEARSTSPDSFSPQSMDA
jgi:hypothetical protein